MIISYLFFLATCMSLPFSEAWATYTVTSGVCSHCMIFLPRASSMLFKTSKSSPGQGPAHAGTGSPIPAHHMPAREGRRLPEALPASYCRFDCDHVAV